MKLLYAPGSPYAHRATAVIAELGLQDRIEKIEVAHRDPKGGLWEYNPFAKIPTLIRDDGSVLIESALICEYLDSIGGRKLFPESGEARIRALQFAAYGEGIQEAVVKAFQETHRPEERRWPEEVERLKGKVVRGMNELEAHPDRIEGPVNIGHFFLACGLAFLDRRMAELDWRKEHPRIAAWYKEFAERPSMKATTPK